jgi:folate-binding Fe-S cluster repair protein YgfZ
MHYRATLKHELKLFTIETNQPLQSGNKMLSDQEEIGELIDVCPLGNNTFLIAVSILADHPNTCIFEGQKTNVITLTQSFENHML